MITYVNTVLVSNNSTDTTPVVGVAGVSALSSLNAGQFIIQSLDNNDAQGAISEDTDKIRIGVGLGSTQKTSDSEGNSVSLRDIKWSNEIKKGDIKSYRKMTYTEDTEDTIEIDFSKASADASTAFANGGAIVVLRLTFKDLPTRFRNWTESYDYMTKVGDDAAAIANAFKATINKLTKRARVLATIDENNAPTVLKLEAMKYDDDDSVDSINVYGKVRLNATLYWQNPNAAGFASSNKYPISTDEDFIVKTEGKTYPASAKLVRDRESQSLGYQGILNRGEGTWPIIKPAMVTDLSAEYDALTLEFENVYRAADDIFRKTKQTVEIYAPADQISAIETALAPFVGTPETNLNDTTDGAAYVEPANAE